MWNTPNAVLFLSFLNRLTRFLLHNDDGLSLEKPFYVLVQFSGFIFLFSKGFEPTYRFLLNSIHHTTIDNLLYWLVYI